ncbi:transcriptional Coactivator p15-domain-containing protein [Mycena belliarum]|uniref:Transcriptional Coactivator p15-domain-containing protein n=1 Tax=Mycena belliarum TaxID=1033014 RepID=A0AAD6U0V5_9AGAR|nr:transcriptional Coactivator p15-domain-containing protein [Mycena belliae]
MAKRKSSSTQEDGNSVEAQSKKLKTEPVKTEPVDRDELDESESEAPLKAKQKGKTKNAETEDIDVKSTLEGEKFIELGKNKRVTVRSFKGTTLIDIREFYTDKTSGEQKPGKKGISLGLDQWDELKRAATTLDQLLADVRK